MRIKDPEKEGNITMATNQVELEAEVHYNPNDVDSDNDLKFDLDLRGVSNTDLEAEKEGYDYVETARTSESGDVAERGHGDDVGQDDDDDEDFDYDNDDPLPIQLEMSDPSDLQAVRRSLRLDDDSKRKVGSLSARDYHEVIEKE